MLVADDVPEARRTVIYKAVSVFWHLGARHIYVQDVPASSAAVSGLPHEGVVAVVAAPPPRSQVDGWTEVLAEDGWLFAAEVRLSDDSVRCACHELGHALGLAHDPRPSNLMFEVNLATATEITSEQIESIL